MTQPLKDSARRVQEAVRALGFDFQVLEFPASTRTAAEAAAAIGCLEAQIAKSLVFARHPSGNPVLVIASGANRVDESRLAALCGEQIRRADADYVKEQTGFAIGGIPPVGHIQPLPTWLDEDLQQYPEIWAAAGTPNAVFRLTPAALHALTGGQWAAVRK